MSSTAPALVPQRGRRHGAQHGAQQVARNTFPRLPRGGGRERPPGAWPFSLGCRKLLAAGSTWDRNTFLRTSVATERFGMLRPRSRAHQHCQAQGRQIPPRLPAGRKGFLALDRVHLRPLAWGLCAVPVLPGAQAR